MGRVYQVTIIEDGIKRTYIMEADSFDEAYRHIREEHALEIILKMEEIVSIRDL